MTKERKKNWNKLSMGCQEARCLLGLGDFCFRRSACVCMNTVCACASVFSHACMCTYGRSCVPALMQACVHTHKCVKIMHEHMCGWICLRVCACTNADKESLSVSLKPRGSRGQLAASCSQAACTLPGHSSGLQPPIPGADIWRLSV